MSEHNLPSWIRTLSTSYTVEILEITAQPKSASEISAELDAPIATVYRRLDDLAEAKLLTIDGSRLSDDGRREKIYRRTIDGFSIDFTIENLVVETEIHSEARASLADTWSTLRSPT